MCSLLKKFLSEDEADLDICYAAPLQNWALPHDRHSARIYYMLSDGVQKEFSQVLEQIEATSNERR